MFPSSFTLKIKTTSALDGFYKKPSSITPKLIQCIDGHYYDELSLVEIITMFNDGKNDLFNNQLNPLQTLVSVIVFCLSESKMPENSIELGLFLGGKDINKTFNTEDFDIILAKFEAPEINSSDMYHNSIFDRINFEEIKDKIKDKMDLNNDDSDYSPVVEHFISSSDL